MTRKFHMTSSKKLSFVRSYKQGDSLKPKGLWYSLDVEWLEWCLCEMRHWVEEYSHEIEIDYSNILLIESQQGVIDFESKYGKNVGTTLVSGFSYFQIDWDKLSQDYSGIEIRNYHKLKRNISAGELSRRIWLSGWDVSSGCIWNLSCVSLKETHSTQSIKELAGLG